MGHREKAFVISDLLGTVGGAYLAPLLLSRSLSKMGMEVKCFSQNTVLGDDPRPTDFEIVKPLIRKGCRWDVPGFVLSSQIKSRIRREHPEFVFVCGVTPLARRLLECDAAQKCVIWEFSNATHGNKFGDKKAICLLNRSRSLLSPSTAIDHKIRETYNYSGRILRLPFWIEDFSLLPAETPEDTITDFICLGRRDPEKGLFELIKATAAVVRTHPDIRVLITGPGSDQPYRSLATKLGVSKNISFKFFPTRSETMDALRKSKCLVLPSYHEGYPLALLEAGQLSVPFIASKVGSVDEVFGGTGAGILIPSRDVHALAEAMVRILRQTVREYNAMRDAANKAFQRVSSKNVVQGSLRQVLDELRNHI